MTTGGAFTFKSERRAHPGAVARRFRDIVRSRRPGHRRGSMAIASHNHGFAYRRFSFDRFGRGCWGGFGHRCFHHGFRGRNDGFHWRFNDRRRFHHFRFNRDRLGVDRHWRNSLRRFDSWRFDRRWLDSGWLDNFRSINDNRLGGRDGFDDHRLSGNGLHGRRLDGNWRGSDGFNYGNRCRNSFDGFNGAGVLNRNLFRLLVLRAPQFAHCPLLLAAEGRRLSKRDGDQSLENLRAKYTAEEIVGKLAYAYGLQPEPAPRTPESLIPEFSWAKVPKEDVCLPEGLF